MPFQFTAYAQTTKVSGIVVDKETREPLPFVNLTFKGTKIGTSTDINGNFVLETYYASDSLRFSLIGYTTLTLPIKKDKTNTLNVALSASNKSLREVVVNAKDFENPAWRIIRATLANKDINNKAKLIAYEYEVYNKIEFDMKNFQSKLRKNLFIRPFRFIFNYVDTVGEDYFLPLFISESLSEFYYRKSPTQKKEIIKATKTGGMQNESVSRLLGDSYQNINVYENDIMVFGRSFVSPISNAGFGFYRYYLQDSAFIENQFCYKITFQPKRKQELTFGGEMWINDTTFAIKKIQAGIAKDANINYIQNFEFTQEYKQVEKEVWMLNSEHLIFEAAILVPHKLRKQHFVGRKVATYQNFKINKLQEAPFYVKPDNIIMADSSFSKPDSFWVANRHVTLTEHDNDVYTISDSIPKVPLFKFYTNVVKGYNSWGVVDFGPYFTTYSFNALEGNRFKLSARTNTKFNKHLGFEAYTAYGTKDREFKYGGKVNYYFKRIPRSLLSAGYRNDVEQFGLALGIFKEDNILTSALRRTAIRSYNQVKEVNIFFEKDWFNGFGNKFQFKRKELLPIGDLAYDAENTLGQLVNVNKITTVEFSVNTRFAYSERFLGGNFQRISLGTQFPILDVNFTWSLKGFLEGDYSYQKLVLSVKDKIKLRILGTFKYRVEAGKIWGSAPYPILELHAGNQTFLLNDNTFNTMNYFEFVSDQYASTSVSQHFEGLLFNKIPIMRKLNWREVVSAKALVGNLSKSNESILLLPTNLYTLSSPYYEVSAGIENIFQIFRVDALWRLTYLDHPNITKFGIRFKMQFEF
jgi:hypothetical protein